MRHGEGTYIDTYGNKYSGTWDNNLLQGFGTYVGADKNIYKGNWKDGKRVGQGIEIW